MHTETVYCKDCEKELARWGGGRNFQYEEEWECPAMFRQKVKDHWRDKSGKSVLVSDKPDAEHPFPLKSEMNYCALIYKTKYCRKCAQKRHFHCGRPKCKGHLVKVRNEDGSDTEYTHGGF